MRQERSESAREETTALYKRRSTRKGKKEKKQKEEKPISIEDKQGVTRGNIDHSGSWCGSRLPCLQHQHRLLFLAMAPHPPKNTPSSPRPAPPPPTPPPGPTGCNLKSPLGEAVSRRGRRGNLGAVCLNTRTSLKDTRLVAPTVPASTQIDPLHRWLPSMLMLNVEQLTRDRSSGRTAIITETPG